MPCAWDFYSGAPENKDAWVDMAQWLLVFLSLNVNCSDLKSIIGVTPNCANLLDSKLKLCLPESRAVVIRTHRGVTATNLID